MNLKLVKLQLSIGILLGLLLALEWYDLDFSQADQQQDSGAVKADKDPVNELPKLEKTPMPVMAYSELVERPLFLEGRRPLPDIPAADTQKVAELSQLDDWLLIGIFNKDKRQMALFSKKNEAKKYLKIGIDQSISGWVIKEIQPDHVVLQQSDQQKSIRLRKPRANAKPPEKPATPPKAVKPPPPAKKTNTEKEE